MPLEVSVGPLEDVDDAEDVSAGDYGAADVHQEEDGSDLVSLFVCSWRGFWIENAGFEAAPVEVAF